MSWRPLLLQHAPLRLLLAVIRVGATDCGCRIVPTDASSTAAACDVCYVSYLR
jgi:hypothetical protein